MLGGKTHIFQPREGYRAGTDPVLLAASVQARSGQSVLDLGCGGGVALCCLGARVAGLQLAGLELQPGYADLARRNLDHNGLTGTIWTGDVACPPADLRAQNFDHVIANPPYFETARGVVARDSGRGTGRAGEIPLDVWVATAAKRLRPRGYATFIQRIERLPELMAAMHGHLGSLELLPLLPRTGRPPRLFLIRGRKNGRAPFVCHTPRPIHPDTIRPEQPDNYTESFRNVMLLGKALDFATPQS